MMRGGTSDYCGPGAFSVVDNCQFATMPADDPDPSHEVGRAFGLAVGSK